MFRRTFLAFAGAAAALRTKVLGQSRGELNRMAEEQLAVTPFKAESIMSLDIGGLASVLQDPAATDFAKAKACQRLALVGDESAVPALEALLGSARLSHYARTALEPLPGAAADAALRGSLGTLDGPLLVGVIHSIGVRRDREAIGALAPLRYVADSRVADAATWAIHRIRRP